MDRNMGMNVPDPDLLPQLGAVALAAAQNVAHRYVHHPKLFNNRPAQRAFPAPRSAHDDEPEGWAGIFLDQRIRSLRLGT